MKDLVYSVDDPIFALATPWAESALGVVRISGKGVIEQFAPLFSRPEELKKAQGQTIHYGRVRDLQGQTLDEINLAVFRAPRSYTGEDSLEISCHGSLPGIQRILEALQKAGFRPAGPGEFTLRAFLNKKMDLTQAEAVQEIVTSKSIRAQNLALHRLGGSIHQRIEGIKAHLLNLLSQVDIQLDYAEDDVEDLDFPLEGLRKAKEAIQELIATYRTGKIYQEGVKVVLAGKTNAGKSSLFNLFLKEERSIVSDSHGTTRDYLESWVSLDGIPVRLFDTAGLREAEDLVEQEGIRRTKGIIQSSQIILYVVDGTRGLSPEDEAELAQWEDQDSLLCLWNKVDQYQGPVPQGFLPLSAVTGQGFVALEAQIKNLIFGGKQAVEGDVVIDSLRQKDLLERALTALSTVESAINEGLSMDMVALDLKEAMDALGEITGEVTTSDILNNMFSNFCVGK
jgi:tRNA modification GTPase